MIVAILSVGSFAARTCPALAEAYGGTLTAVDAFTAGLSLVDYVLRVVAAPELKCYRSLPHWRGRIRYVLSLYGLLNALSVFPALLALWEGFLPPLWARIFRLLTLLRTHQSQVTSTVSRVLYANRRILTLSAVVCLFLLLWTSAILWVVASSSPEHAEAFPTMFSALYMALLMLTGAGMPEGDLPPAMRAMVSVTALLSVAFFAIPAAMLTWGFEGEAERLARRELRQERLRRLQGSDHHGRLTVAHVAKRLGEKRTPHESASAHRSGHITSSSSEGDTSMEEYLQGLGGGEDPEDLMDEALSFFEACDPHGNSPLLPRAQQRALELQHQAEVQTLRQDLRQTAYSMLMKLPARMANAKHKGAATMTVDLHEEVRLRRFAQTARAYLPAGTAGDAGGSPAAALGTAGDAGGGPAAALGAAGLPAGEGTPAAVAQGPAAAAHGQDTLDTLDTLMMTLTSEVAQLRRVVDNRLRSSA